MPTKSEQDLEAERRDLTIDFGARLHDILDLVERERMTDYIQRTEGHLVCLVYPTEPAIKRIMEKVNDDWVARDLLTRLCYLYGVPYDTQERRTRTTDQIN